MKKIIILISSSFILLFSLHSEKLQQEKTVFIFITGGSASGKSTLAKALAKKIGEDQTLCLHLDEYQDKRVQPLEDYIDGMPNFDKPSMINWDLVLENIKKLKNNEPIKAPIYSFEVWMPIGFKEVAPKQFIIIEGIHALQSYLDDIAGIRIYIEADRDLRLQRRIARDVVERSTTKELSEETFYKMAVPYEKIYVIPTKNKADIIVETFLDHADIEQTCKRIITMMNEKHSELYLN